MRLLTAMQECGSPPDEIVADMSTGLFSNGARRAGGGAGGVAVSKGMGFFPPFHLPISFPLFHCHVFNRGEGSVIM